MSEKENPKVIILSKHIPGKLCRGNNSDIKNFLGFDYVKMEKDLNGTPFVKESLTEYAQNCQYMVRVMREKKSGIFLYNYYVPNDKLCYFLTKIESGQIDGQVIEVEKYIPEDLA